MSITASPGFSDKIHQHAGDSKLLSAQKPSRESLSMASDEQAPATINRDIYLQGYQPENAGPESSEINMQLRPMRIGESGKGVESAAVKSRSTLRQSENRRGSEQSPGNSPSPV